MKLYRIRIVNMKTKEDVEVMEICCPHITKAEFNRIVNHMFATACEWGCDAVHLRAIVKDVYNYLIVFVVDSKTVVDGSSIYCDIYCLHKHFVQTGFYFVRRMEIAS